jgi:hypothetical protein
VTVVIGVVSVAVVPVGVVAVTVAIGVLTVTVAGDVGIGSVGNETVGTRSVAGNSDGSTWAVDERTDAGAASPPEPSVGAGPAVALEPPAVLR